MLYQAKMGSIIKSDTSNHRYGTLVGLFDVFFHLLNLIAPAVVVAGVLAFVGQKIIPPSSQAYATRTILLINALVGIAILILGMLIFGHDGKIATYALLIVVQAGVQVFLGQGR